MPTPVIAIFDIGKTNKKLFLFDEQYRIVFEQSAQFRETVDEDGYPCEDLEAVSKWVITLFHSVCQKPAFSIRALNFTTYGASLVFLDKEGKPLTPLYNYLKPYPEHLQQQVYSANGGVTAFSLQTASPVLGSLNSAMQIFRLRWERPDVFAKLHRVLHLPQYFSYLFTKKMVSDITSIGCHTYLWDFKKNKYHAWLKAEELQKVLAPLAAADTVQLQQEGAHSFFTGVGLHDSSAALIPYLASFSEPFVLISSGTWCISLNPFNEEPLTPEELEQDCLCYLSYQGTPVKASRLFAGAEHDQQVTRIAEYFGVDAGILPGSPFDAAVMARLNDCAPDSLGNVLQQRKTRLQSFAQQDLAQFNNWSEAYHALMQNLVQQQRASTQLVLNSSKTKRIFVDGGFSKNEIYMRLLAFLFPQIKVYAATVAQATAVGAALCIHKAWNGQPLPQSLIGLKHYPHTHDVVV